MTSMSSWRDAILRAAQEFDTFKCEHEEDLLKEVINIFDLETRQKTLGRHD